MCISNWFPGDADASTTLWKPKLWFPFGRPETDTYEIITDHLCLPNCLLLIERSKRTECKDACNAVKPGG